VPPPGWHTVVPARRPAAVDPNESSVPIFSTIWSDDREYNERVDVLDWRELGWRGLTRRMLGATAGDVVIVNGALGFSERWRDMILSTLLRLRRRGVGLVVTDVTWDPRSVRQESTAGWLWSANRALGRGLVRAVGRHGTVLCFLSTVEVDHFLTETRSVPARAVFTPFFTTTPGDREAIVAAAETRRRATGPYAFAGGDTLRNWDLLVDALGSRDLPVRVATRHTDRRWPPNFSVGPVGRDEFFSLAAGASVGVVPLRADVTRSAGQQTYLNLLYLGVPVVVNDAPGVRDHLDGVPGAWITPAADAAAMGDRIGWLLDADNAGAAREAAGAGAAVVTSRFSESAYLRRIVDIADELHTDS
jgi:hypothetical protein